MDDGGAQSSLLLQLLANALRVVMLRPVVTETTALGAAQLAGLGVGLWDNTDQLATQWLSDRRFLPETSEARRQHDIERWRAVTAGISALTSRSA